MIKFNNETLAERIKSKDFSYINEWDVSEVTNMRRLFDGHSKFNEDIDAF